MDSNGGGDDDDDEESSQAPAAPLFPFQPIWFGNPHAAFNLYHGEEPESYVDNDSDILDVEADPDYPLQAARLDLQQDSDLSDDEDESGEFLDEHGYDIRILGPNGGSDLNALTSSWRPPTPKNHRPILEGVFVSPVEESLLSILIENHLPKRMYSAMMECAHYASSQDYDFTGAPTYQTVLGRMIRKYINVSGGPPKSEIVHVPNHAPMHVYRFDFLMHVSRLLSNPDLMHDSLWGYNPQVDPVSHERVYSEMNTGDFWKLGEDYVANRKNKLDPSLRDGLPHRFCPINIFVDKTLVDRIGRLNVEPVLCSVANICGEKRSAASSWFILGLIPPNPKSSKELEADRKSVSTRRLVPCRSMLNALPSKHQFWLLVLVWRQLYQLPTLSLLLSPGVWHSQY